VLGVNLPFNLPQDPCVAGVGNGESRPTSAVPGSSANGENAAKATVRAEQSVLTVSVKSCPSTLC
jgi:hypothetical protein